MEWKISNIGKHFVDPNSDLIGNMKVQLLFSNLYELQNFGKTIRDIFCVCLLHCIDC